MTKDTHKADGLSRGVIRVMGIFSGIQMFNILCSIVKMKLVALWLQAEGVGLFGMYNTTVETIATFTNMGLRQSTVRDIAIVKNDSSRISRIVTIVRRWSLAAGLLGSIIISGAAPLLAKLIFGDWTHCWGFVALSASMLLNALLMGEQSVLQGIGKLKALAKGSFWGTLLGLLVSIPLFYWLRDDSVVPSIVIYSIFTLLFTLPYRFKSDNVARQSVSLRQTYEEGRGFVRLGICMSIATFITNIAHLVFLAYLNRTVSTEEVGYFQAGSTLVIRYAGLIFTAVGMEFFPRLSANNAHPSRVNLFVSHEITILLLVLTPVILIFLLLRQWMVELLYTSEFQVIIPFISWAMMCNIFKAVSWCMAHSIVAKGDGKLYILTEGVDAIVGLTLNILLYQWLGLIGIGVAYILWFFSYCLIVGYVFYKKYHFKISKEAFRTIAITTVACFAALYMMEILPLWINAILFAFVGFAFIRALLRLYRRRKSY